MIDRAIRALERRLISALLAMALSPLRISGALVRLSLRMTRPRHRRSFWSGAALSDEDRRAIDYAIARQRHRRTQDAVHGGKS